MLAQIPQWLKITATVIAGLAVVNAIVDISLFIIRKLK